MDEVLDLSKMTEETPTIKWSTSNVKSYLSRVAGAFDTLGTQRKINYTIDIEASDASGVTDFGKLEKCLNNLLINAFKFTSDGGKVSFRAEFRDQKLRVEVSDSGEGIPEDEQDKIFQRYYQSKRTQRHGGTGVGLSLVKEYMDLLNGSISVKSVQNEGSVFTLTVPIRPDHEAADPYIDFINQDQGGTTSLRPTMDISDQPVPHILIAEDNSSMSDFIRDLLSPSYRVTVAHTGEQAWDRIRKQPFDLVISDVMMPGLDGYELVQRLREIEKLNSLPVIILSAMAMPEDKVHGFKLGVNDYLGKPFHPDELKARIRHLLERSHVRNEADGNEGETSVDEAFIQTARNEVLENLTNPAFGVKQLAEKLNNSERNLQRLIKRETGLTSVQFIREIRLLEAYRMLQERKKHTVSEVSYAVGIETVSYFSKMFQSRFGIGPNQLLG